MASQADSYYRRKGVEKALGTILALVVCECGIKHRASWYRREAIGPMCDVCYFAKRRAREPDVQQDISDAVARIKRAGVKASDQAILAWVGSVGPKTILESTLKEIREVASGI